MGNLEKIELHEDLRNSIIKTSLGEYIHHPLIIMPLRWPKDVINDTYEQKVLEREQAYEEKNFSQYLTLHERPYRLEALLYICCEVEDPSTLGKLIRDTWVDTEYPHQNLNMWKSIFRRFREDKQYLMTPEEKEKYDSLPNKFTIYRGGSSKRGISWTLNPEIAEWFCDRFKYDIENRMVFTREARKRDTICYLNSRNEEEILFIRE